MQDTQFATTSPRLKKSVHVPVFRYSNLVLTYTYLYMYNTYVHHTLSAERFMIQTLYKKSNGYEIMRATFIFHSALCMY